MRNKVTVLLFVVLVVFYVGSIFVSTNKLSENSESADYQNYIREYEKKIQENIETQLVEEDNAFTPKMQYQASNSTGTIGNFEGPQVHLKGIKFHNEYLTQEDERLKHIDAISAHFDPDHTYYGLPDVKISVQDVRLYQPEKGVLSEFLSFGSDDEPKPFKIYKKKIIGNSDTAKVRFLEMQLWLTEFNVSIDIRPDRDIPISISDEEKNMEYPGFWYGSSQASIKLKDLGKEHKDFRYGNLSFILEVIPDNSPIYVKTKDGFTTKADFAIASVYCKEAIIGNEPDVQRISTNIHSGQPVFLNNSFDFEEMNQNTQAFSENVEANAAKLLEIKSVDSDFIWNKPYYLKLFFNNLGSWRSGLFNQNQFHDQVNYSFLMPVFVVGSWDVIVPQEILPEWNPPKAYVRKITFKNFIPFWNAGILGRFASFLLMGLILFLAFPVFFKGLWTIWKK